jgi:hypothetical protein
MLIANPEERNLVMIRQELRNLKQSWKSARDLWLERYRKAEEYYYNDVDGSKTPYTRLQLTKIADMTGMPASVNFLYPAVAQELALLLQNKPSFKTVGLDSRYNDFAAVLDKIKHAILYHSDAVTELQESLKVMLIGGLSHLDISPTNKYTPGMMNLSLTHEHPENVILDPNASRRTLADLEGYFLEKEITLEKAIALFGEIFEEIAAYIDPKFDPRILGTMAGDGTRDRTSLEGASWGWNEQSIRVNVSQFHYKRFTTMYMVKDEQTGDIMRYFAENLYPEDQDVLQGAIAKYPDFYVSRITCMGEYEIDETVLPITDYTLHTFVYDWGGKPYRSYGMVHWAYGAQETFDKSLQIFIQNGIKANNPGKRAPKGGIADEDRQNWELYGSDPTRVKEYVPKLIGNQVLVPEDETVQPLSNFYPLLLEMMKNGIDTTTGIGGPISGNVTDNTIETFSTLQKYESAAMQRIVMLLQNVNATHIRLGNVLNDLILANLKPGAKYVFFDENGDLMEITLANNLAQEKTAKFITLSIPAQAMPSQKLAVSMELFKISQSTEDPVARAVYAENAIKNSGVRAIEGLQEQINMGQRQQQQITQLQEELQRSKEIMKQYENRALLAEYNRKLAELLSGAERDIDVAVTKEEMQAKIDKLKEKESNNNNGKK